MQKTTFLNVDIDIYSKKNINALLKALRNAIVIQNQDSEGFTSISAKQHTKTINSAILNYYRIIEGLPKKEKDIWYSCNKRILNIGIQGGAQPHEKPFTLSKKSIEYAQKLGAEIIFTVYGHQ